MVVHGRHQTPKNTSFLGSPSSQGSQSPYILGDTTRPRHVTCVIVWSKSDRRRLRKSLHKQTDRQTDTTKIMVTWPWTNSKKTIMTLFETLQHIMESMTVVWLSDGQSKSTRHRVSTSTRLHFTFSVMLPQQWNPGTNSKIRPIVQN